MFSPGCSHVDEIREGDLRRDQPQLFLGGVVVSRPIDVHAEMGQGLKSMRSPRLPDDSGDAALTLGAHPTPEGCAGSEHCG